MQFAADTTFHILFPTISVALAWTLLFLRLRWLKTHHDARLVAHRFWTKVFALTFALGVVSGIRMSAFWILALNSWRHTPASCAMRGSEFFVKSWLDVVFNASLP